MLVPLTNTVPSIISSVLVLHSVIMQAIPWVLVYALLRMKLILPLYGTKDNPCNFTPDNGWINCGPVVTFIL